MLLTALRNFRISPGSVSARESVIAVGDRSWSILHWKRQIVVSKRNIFLHSKPLENQVETVSAQFLARISWAFISLLIPCIGFWRSTGQTWIISEVSRTPRPFSTRHNKLALGCLWQKLKPTAGTWCPLHHTAEEHHLLWTSQLIFKVGKMSMHPGYLSTFRLGDDGK